MNRTKFFCLNSSPVIYGLAEDVKYASQKFLAHRHHYRLAGVQNQGTPRKPLRGREGNPAYRFGVEVNQYLYHRVTCFEKAIDCRKLFLESNVHNAAPDRGHHALVWLVISLLQAFLL